MTMITEQRNVAKWAEIDMLISPKYLKLFLNTFVLRLPGPDMSQGHQGEGELRVSDNIEIDLG